MRIEDEFTIEEISEYLPKYIRIDTGHSNEHYVLVIIKNDWDGHGDSWIIMYSKENSKSYSSVKTLIKVEGATLLDTMNKAKIAIERFREENKNNPKILKY